MLLLPLVGCGLKVITLRVAGGKAAGEENPLTMVGGVPGTAPRTPGGTVGGNQRLSQWYRLLSTILRGLGPRPQGVVEGLPPMGRAH